MIALPDDVDECSRCGRLLPLDELIQVDEELLCVDCDLDEVLEDDSEYD